MAGWTAISNPVMAVSVLIMMDVPHSGEPVMANRFIFQRFYLLFAKKKIAKRKKEGY